MVIRELHHERGAICNDLLRALPQWFGIESAIQQYVLDVESMPTFVAYDEIRESRAIGFISLKIHNEWTAEIHVMAVRPEFHRNGIGRKLLETAEHYLRSLQYKFLSVKTLSPSRADDSYELTRRFYFSLGFRPIEEFKKLWGEANPCLFMIKSL